jgi:membrane-associated phospholipid phosphatase
MLEPLLAPAMDGGPLAASSLDALRQFGAVETVRAVLSPTADAVAFAVTNLGDSWFLLVALTLFYWYASEREDGALAVALALAALALVTFLKHAFAMPRPPAALQAYPEDGYGFPSGHALGSTVAWGAMAWLGDRWERRHGLAVAVPVVVAVGFSRVVLGVHYLGSVLAGFAIGVVFLAGILRFARDSLVWPFATAAGLAILAAATGAVADGATVLGGVVGGGLAWWRLDLEGTVHPVAAVGGLVVFGGVFVAALAAEPPWPVLVVADAVVVGGLFAVPAMERTARAHLGRAAKASAPQNVPE